MLVIADTSLVICKRFITLLKEFTTIKISIKHSTISKDSLSH